MFKFEREIKLMAIWNIEGHISAPFPEFETLSGSNVEHFKPWVNSWGVPLPANVIILFIRVSVNEWSWSNHIAHFDAQTTIARGDEAGPHKITDTMAFMFESCLIPRVCSWALESPLMDRNYYHCWIGLRSHFTGEGTDMKSLSIQNGHDDTESGGKSIVVNI